MKIEVKWQAVVERYNTIYECGALLIVLNIDDEERRNNLRN